MGSVSGVGLTLSALGRKRQLNIGCPVVYFPHCLRVRALLRYPWRGETDQVLISLKLVPTRKDWDSYATDTQLIKLLPTRKD